MHTHIHTNRHIHTCTHTFYICIYIYTHTYIYMHTCIHTHIQINIYTDNTYVVVTVDTRTPNGARTPPPFSAINIYIQTKLT